MRQSRTIAVDIDRPLRVVYDFLAQPQNYPRWAPVVDNAFEPIEPLVWRAVMPFGERIVRFCGRNEFGVLDHSEEPPGGEAIVNAMRVIACDNGCTLTFTFFRRETMSDPEFTSAVEWIQADLWAFKSLIETGVQ